MADASHDLTLCGPPGSTSRRRFLCKSGLGIGGLGLLSLLQETGFVVASTGPGEGPQGYPAATRQPHFPAKAKRIIQFFAVGGPSHVDTFDPKPALEKYHDQRVDEVMKNYQKQAGEAAAGMGRLSGKLQRSAFKFQKHGKSGLDISELFPKLAAHADDLCVVRSMSTTTSVHEPAELMMNSGSFTAVRPSLGAWTVYGLGSENQNLPGFVALSGSAKTCASAFLPAWCQATVITNQGPEVEKMLEHIRAGSTSLREQRRQLDLIAAMHDEFVSRHPADAALDGRMTAFETAFRMQVEAADAFDIQREPTKIREMYGDSPLGRQLLLARRLSERGVRFVQINNGGWDTHDMNDEQHRKLTEACDGPLAALLADLKQRDMLKDTLVLWGGEFGRTPTSDNNDVASKKGIGRDHNAGGFTVWMAGGGVKAGHIHGATDDFGALATVDRMDNHDLHATILHLLGFDHTRLTFRHAGRDFRLTDVYGNVARKILA